MEVESRPNSGFYSSRQTVDNNIQSCLCYGGVPKERIFCTTTVGAFLTDTSIVQAWLYYGHLTWSYWAFSIYKKIPKFSIGNFRLGKARFICHKSHSGEAWPLNRLRKAWNW